MCKILQKYYKIVYNQKNKRNKLNVKNEINREARNKRIKNKR